MVKVTDWSIKLRTFLGLTKNPIFFHPDSEDSAAQTELKHTLITILMTYSNNVGFPHIAALIVCLWSIVSFSWCHKLFVTFTIIYIIWPTACSGFPKKRDSSQSPQLQRLARKLKFHL